MTLLLGVTLSQSLCQGVTTDRLVEKTNFKFFEKKTYTHTHTQKTTHARAHTHTASLVTRAISIMRPSIDFELPLLKSFSKKAS